MVINSLRNQYLEHATIILANQKAKEIIKKQNEQLQDQIQQENYERLEKEYDDFFEREGYLYPIKKRNYILKNGLIIKNRRQFIKRTYRCEKVLGYDVETYKGKCKLICNSEGKKILNPSFLDCIKLLFYLADNSNTYRFFYNIDFDFSAILKLWKSELNIKAVNNRILKKIVWLKNGIEVSYKCYKIKWIKGRMITIKHIIRKKSVIYTDIFNFLPLGLKTEAENYLDDFKIDDVDGNLLNTSLDYWNKKEKDIIEYCIQDCIITEKLGKLLIDTIEKNDLPLPRYLVSSASLSKQFFRLNCFIPSIYNIPEIILQISYDTYFGGRFEIFKKGFFDDLYLYDINSQYPDFIKDLPNMRDGLWKKTLDIPKKQCIAYFLVKVDIPKDYNIPTIPINHKGVNKFPCGIIKKWITWFDLDLIRDFIIEIYDGYIFIPTHRNYKPFNEGIDYLFKKKQKLKGIKTLDYNLTKLTMNAFYGCFVEIHKNYDKKGNFTLNSGILFNSVYASQITAFGRWSVIKDIPKEKYDNIIAIHTDSIISDIPLDNYLTLNLEIGNWNKEVDGKGIIMNTGMYQIGYLIKTRGIPKRFIINWLRFCFKNQIYKRKMFVIPHMRKLSEGLIRDKNLDNVNTIMNDKRSINCNSDSKRDWIIDFRSFKEVLSINIDSYPLICYNDLTELHPNPLGIAYRFEN